MRSNSCSFWLEFLIFSFFSNMSRSVHSWEEPLGEDQRPLPNPHSWEVGSTQDGGESSSSDPEDDEDRAPPGRRFADFASELYYSRVLSAKQMCTLMFWASKAGVEEAAPLAFRPNAPSGHFQRHLNKVLEPLLDKSVLYRMPVPSYSADKLARSVHDLCVLPLHEVVDEMYSTDATLRVQLEEKVELRELPEAYYSHTLKQREPESSFLPISIFVDAVPYSQVDSVIGFWVLNEISSERRLLVSLRKQICCICGCRGWCSFRPVWSFLHWSLAALAKGVYPERRHDGSPFLETDTARRSRAGKRMSCKALLLYLKGDWAEYATTCGLPAWSDGLRPCFKCNSTKALLYICENLSEASLPWMSNGEDDWFVACDRCEIVVVVPNAVVHRTLVEHLSYDKRKQGSRGLSLTRPVDELGLKEGDRLCAGLGLEDVADVMLLTVFPVSLVFWRPAYETLARNRNPIFDRELGVTVCRSLTIDLLHCLYLGIMLAFCKTLVWDLITSGFWVSRGAAEEVLENSCLVIRHQLRAFCTRHARDRPSEPITRISNFRKKRLGDNADRKLKTKGAETWCFLLFLVDALSTREGLLSASHRAQLAAGRALVELVRLWQSCEANLTATQIQKSWDLWNSFLSLTEENEEQRVPKRHLFTHLLWDMRRLGNPRLYMNWADESANRILKGACRTVSQATFEGFLLLRMTELMRKKGLKRKLGS